MMHHFTRRKLASSVLAIVTSCALTGLAFGQEGTEQSTAPATTAEDAFARPVSPAPSSTPTLGGLFNEFFGTSDTTEKAVAPPSQPVTSPPLAVGNTWVTIACGLPGDVDHRLRMTEAITKLTKFGPTVLGVAPERLRVLAGDERMAEDLAESAGNCKVTTAETLTSALNEVAKSAAADDTHWLFILGHGNLYGKRSLMNVEGPDIDQEQFGKIVEPLKCRRSIVWLTQPTSGFWIRSISKANAISISATEAGAEITATEMPYALADVLAGEAKFQALEDIDKDGYLTLFDLYLATCIEVAARFTAEGFLQTEHAQLDDNGDGRGKELQTDFLPDALESRFSLRNTPLRLGSDGALAKTVPIYLSPKAQTGEKITDGN